MYILPPEYIGPTLKSWFWTEFCIIVQIPSFVSGNTGQKTAVFYLMSNIHRIHTITSECKCKYIFIEKQIRFRRFFHSGKASCGTDFPVLHRQNRHRHTPPMIIHVKCKVNRFAQSLTKYYAPPGSEIYKLPFLAGCSAWGSFPFSFVYIFSVTGAEVSFFMKIMN